MRIGAICVLGLLLCTCAGLADESFIVWGDRPEYAAYIDYYNTLDPQHRGYFQYKEQIFPDHIDRTTPPPHVIIAEHIAYRGAKRVMRTIPRSILNTPPPGTFYENILSVGTIGRSQRVIPLSFNIPIVIFNRNQSFEFLTSPAVTLEQLRREAEQLNRYTDETLSRVGFAPQWDGHFLYLGTKAYGANYREDRQNNIRWNEQEIFEALRYFRNWNRDIEEEDLSGFVERYLREPLHARVTDQRIGFFVSDLTTYSRLDFDQFDFRPLTNAQGIFIEENMTFIGMHRYRRNNAQAQQFVRWIIQQEAQNALIEHTEGYNIDIFGFANGLSTIKEISARTIPRYYPWLIGSTLGISSAFVPSQLPKYWHRIREEVLEPWLKNFLNGVNQESIENEIVKWRKREEFR